MQEVLGNVILPKETVTQVNLDTTTITHLIGADTIGYENELYFYHGNHLSSTQMITDINANVTQQVFYAPFGEVISESNAYWNNGQIPDFMFNAKELDEENGMYYYSARYYAPPVFTSRDPLFEKYPSISPYAYTLNNPLIFIDPTGRTPWPIDKNFNGGTRKVVSGMYRNKNNVFHGAVDIAHKTSNGRQLSGGDVIATHDGTVTQSGTSQTAGNWVQITNGDVRTSYMHLQNPSNLKKGQQVNEFDYIGNVGNTGNSEAPHLHYQMEMKNSETGAWEKINPIVGGQDKVNESMINIDLIDPQMLLAPKDGGILPNFEIQETNPYKFEGEIKSRTITEIETILK
jgi:RHS repeat-associated protein